MKVTGCGFKYLIMKMCSFQLKFFDTPLYFQLPNMAKCDGNSTFCCDNRQIPVIQFSL